MNQFTKHLGRWIITASFAWWYLLLSPYQTNRLLQVVNQPTELAQVMGAFDSNYDCELGGAAVLQNYQHAAPLGCWDDGGAPGPWWFEIFDGGGAGHVRVAQTVGHFASLGQCQEIANEARTVTPHAKVTDCWPLQ